MDSFSSDKLWSKYDREFLTDSYRDKIMGDFVDYDNIEGLQIDPVTGESQKVKPRQDFSDRSGMLNKKIEEFFKKV